VEVKNYQFEEMLTWPKMAWGHTAEKRPFFYIIGVVAFLFSFIGMNSLVGSIVSSIVSGLVYNYTLLLIFHWQKSGRFNIQAPLSLLQDKKKCTQVIFYFVVQILFGIADFGLLMSGSNILMFLLSMLQIGLLAFVLPLILFKDETFKDAFTKSLNIVLTNISSLFFLFLISMGYMIILALPIFIGILVFLPGIMFFPYLVYSKFLSDIPLREKILETAEVSN
jgi:hypothetical protein